MFWLIPMFIGMGFVIYLLHSFGDYVDQIQDDTAHFYAGRQRDPYGLKFWNMLAHNKEE